MDAEKKLEEQRVKTQDATATKKEQDAVQKKAKDEQDALKKKPRANPFGAAKPVDTNAKELDLEKKRLEEAAAARVAAQAATAADKASSDKSADIATITTTTTKSERSTRSPQRDFSADIKQNGTERRRSSSRTRGGRGARGVYSAPRGVTRGGRGGAMASERRDGGQADGKRAPEKPREIIKRAPILAVVEDSKVQAKNPYEILGVRYIPPFFL